MLEEAPDIAGDGFVETHPERRREEGGESLADDPLLAPPLYNGTFRANIRRAEWAAAKGLAVFSPMPEDERATILPDHMDPREFLAEARKLRDWEASIVSGEELAWQFSELNRQERVRTQELRRENVSAQPTEAFTPVDRQEAVRPLPAPEQRPSYRLRAA
jgi:hypothetical protein